jgi:hypothetical protein
MYLPSTPRRLASMVAHDILAMSYGCPLLIVSESDLELAPDHAR